MTAPPARLALLCALSCLTTACIGAPRGELKRGAVESKGPQRMLLAPPTCASPDGVCDEEYLENIYGLLQSELEFEGHSVVDAHSLVLSARTREESSAELRLFGERMASAETLSQRGAMYLDLPPAQRRELLRQANAQGIVTARIQISARDSARREVTVTLRYGVGEDGEGLAWTSRCEWAANINPSLERAVDETSRCAIDKALGKQTAP